MNRRRPDYDASPERRQYLREQAALVTGRCKVCRELRPLAPGDSCCGPCHYGCDKLARQCGLQHDDLCDDCAFRPGSPEREPTAAHLHRDCLTQLDVVLQQVKNGSGVFYCHKPFLEPEQEWGFDPIKQVLIPLHDEHWRPCGGWVRAFRKEHAE